MTIAYWCILAACFLPVVAITYAKFCSVDAKFQVSDNNAPREFLLRLEGGRKRAVWAEQNTYESLPFFIAAVLVAHQAGAEQATIDMLAMGYIGLRLAYIALYVANMATIRSLVWGGAVACCVGLFVASA